MPAGDLDAKRFASLFAAGKTLHGGIAAASLAARRQTSRIRIYAIETALHNLQEFVLFHFENDSQVLFSTKCFAPRNVKLPFGQ